VSPGCAGGSPFPSDAADSEWVTVAGVIVKGHGAASGEGSEAYPEGTLAQQVPIFLERGLDLRRFHLGTVNVDITPYRLVPVAPAFSFEDIAWTDRIPPETFSFFHCLLRVGEKSREGWIYLPHPETKVEHVQAESVVEIITGHIAGVAPGLDVTIEVDRAEAHIVGVDPQ
jgi:hypothetical protein